MLSVERLYEDLNWILSSANIPAADSAAGFLLGFPKELTAPKLSSALANELINIQLHKDQRLGRHFERLVSLCVQYSDRYDVVSQDEPIRLADGRTLGACDLIVRDLADGQLEHWELALKFFVHSGQGDGLNQWVGPGLRDRLDQKLARMRTHQLCVLDHPEGKVWMESKSWHGELKARRLIMKGRLYERAKTSFSYNSAGLNTDTLSGFWMSLSEFSDAYHNSDKRWSRLDKKLWLSDGYATGDPAAISPHELTELFNKRPNPVCLGNIEDSIINSRIFVAPDDWQEKAINYAEI